MNARIATYPYRPVADAMPADDTPLVVKSGDELPTVGGAPGYYIVRVRDHETGPDSQVDTIQGTP